MLTDAERRLVRSSRGSLLQRFAAFGQARETSAAVGENHLRPPAAFSFGLIVRRLKRLGRSAV